ncbi:MAG: hypothetical protein QOD26_1013 [Betaproteobacteria bacterium]|jgi:hypothetical protein|nr:hypothetical protein [Betaproteobacteria bacterium]
MVTNPGAPPRLGELLTSAGLVSRAEVASALARQAVKFARLGELLVQAGVIKEAVLRAVLAVQEDLQLGRDRDPAELVCSRIGAILRGSALSAESLERALQEHEKGDIPLAEVLVRIGAVTRDQLAGIPARET